MATRLFLGPSARLLLSSSLVTLIVAPARVAAQVDPLVERSAQVVARVNEDTGRARDQKDRGRASGEYLHLDVRWIAT